MMASASSSESSPKSSSAAPSASPAGFSAPSAKSTRRSGASDAARFALASATASGDDRPCAPTLARGDLRRASRAPGDPAWCLPRAESISIATIARGTPFDPPRRGRRLRAHRPSRARRASRFFACQRAHVLSALAETPVARPVASVARSPERDPCGVHPPTLLPRPAPRRAIRRVRLGAGVCVPRKRADPDGQQSRLPRARETQNQCLKFSRARGKLGGFANPTTSRPKFAFYGPDRRGENAIPATPREHYE